MTFCSLEYPSYLCSVKLYKQTTMPVYSRERLESRLQGGLKDGYEFWLFFENDNFRVSDMITQDFRAGMQFHIKEAGVQVTMPLNNKTYWAYKCQVVAQLPSDMELGDLIMGKPTFRVMSAVGEFDDEFCGPMSSHPRYAGSTTEAQDQQ